MAKSYFEKLKDPRWQKRRLEVMNRDNFACTRCGNKEETLNVHHAYYIRGANPWEYPDEALSTLCENCHSDVTAKMQEIYQYVGALSMSQLESL